MQLTSNTGQVGLSSGSTQSTKQVSEPCALQLSLPKSHLGVLLGADSQSVGGGRGRDSAFLMSS